MRLRQDYSAIVAAEAAGIPRDSIVPVYQAFGGGGYSDDGGGQYTLPTASQEAQILAVWAALVPNPVFDYAYSWVRRIQIRRSKTRRLCRRSSLPTTPRRRGLVASSDRRAPRARNGRRLVSRTRSPLPKAVADRRRWQGATTRNSWRYSEEEQRSQRRRDAAEPGATIVDDPRGRRNRAVMRDGGWQSLRTP